MEQKLAENRKEKSRWEMGDGSLGLPPLSSLLSPLATDSR